MSIVLPPATLQNLRQHARYPLRRPCTLIFRDRSMSCLLVDISLGGAGVELPMHVSNYGGFEGLRFQLPDVISCRSDLRWSADRRLGMQFAPVAHRSPALLSLIAGLERAALDGRLDMSGDSAGFARVVNRGHPTRLFPVSWSAARQRR
ncbi:PilZ domain-containing protein [Pseudooceanicola antarcticus]|uniref:PilZ domain-containing protein n=1 Tax=Pseudooceanicola antarcticus TaxID=1247613 RepID=A0A285J2M7_9RHOB|nr:PilZ domain-containing protein [Pseudooceanicola antarcticus]PJE29799.1 PilZ domain-containing protein [Pseudooceanicola antarcticus]SNY54323.1 PilZ domain-containing protein [Pseudooceanicola antarcticus]